MRDGNVCILEKSLSKAVKERQGYVANHVVSIVLEGKQVIKTYEENIVRVSAGEILFIPRGVYYVTDLLAGNGSFRSLLFYLDDQAVEQFLSKTKIQEFTREGVPDHLKMKQIPEIMEFCNSLLRIYGPGFSNDRSVLSLKIQELMHLLNALTTAQSFAEFLFQLTLPQKRNIRSFMEANFDKPLKVEDYAYLTGRSMSTFRRDFRAFFDRNPQKWLQEKRLERAKLLLDEKNISVTDLAYEVGYENISYFIKAFKGVYGASPKQYQMNRNRDQFN